MTKTEFELIAQGLSRFAHTSLAFSDFEDIKDYSAVMITNGLVLVSGFNLEAGCAEYHYAANDAQTLLSNAFARPCLVTFIPREWVPAMEKAGFAVRNAWHDYFLENLDAFADVPDGVSFMRPEECAAVSGVLLSCRGTSRGFTGQSEAWVRSWACAENPNVQNACVLTVRDADGSLAGVLATGTYAREGGNGAICWIREVAVVPARQNRGIARRLLTGALAYGRKCGATRAFLAADEQNANAIHLYESCGFRPSGDESQIDMIKN